MKTKRISIIYELTKNGPVAVDPLAESKKNEWIAQATKEVEADWKPMALKVEYRLYNPQVDDIRGFFNGPIVEYWKIQSSDMIDRRPTPAELRAARETILSDQLGYDVELVGRIERRRKSTSEWMSTQKWMDFIETLRETEFDPNGYEMPDSEEYWKLAESVGPDQAREQMVKKLQAKIAAKLGGDNDAR